MVVLIAFATSHLSTQGVAERVAARLQQRGLAAEARPVTGTLDVSDYDAVVIGSAVHGGSWLPEAREFAHLHADRLRQLPVWLFSVSTLGDEESMFRPAAAKRLRAMRRETEEVAALRAELHPREHRNFAGAIARSHWPSAGRAFFRAMGGRYGDHRNWPAIDAWADRIATQLSDASLARVVGPPDHNHPTSA